MTSKLFKIIQGKRSGSENKQNKTAHKLAAAEAGLQLHTQLLFVNIFQIPHSKKFLKEAEEYIEPIEQNL